MKVWRYRCLLLVLGTLFGGCSSAQPRRAGGDDASMRGDGSLADGSLGSDAAPVDGSLGSDAGPVDASTDLCAPTVGLRAPLPACSPETPCERPAPELSGQVLTTPSSMPGCPAQTTLLELEVAGFQRYACVRSVAGGQRPLVLWFHPGGQGAETIEETGLVARAATEALAEPGVEGFHLAVIQGRNLRFPTKEPRDGRHHDFYHRDLGSPSTNPDIAFADAVIDRLVAGGEVDPRRVYVMGWSNGGFFGQLYAIARRNAPTPGGTRVAAAAVFATANPFDDVRWDPFADVARDSDGACRLAQVPASDLPILLVYRTCDAAVAATPDQASCFDNEPGYVTEPWLALAQASGLSITPLRLGGREPGASLDRPADAGTTIACSAPTCTSITPACLCLVNHLIWPDGHYDNASSNLDHEPDMLAFLRAHPLP